MLGVFGESSSDDLIIEQQGQLYTYVIYLSFFFFLHQYVPNSEVSSIHVQIDSISAFSYKMR